MVAESQEADEDLGQAQGHSSSASGFRSFLPSDESMILAVASLCGVVLLSASVK